MIIPLIAASVGIRQVRRAFLWGLLFLALLVLDGALVDLPYQTDLYSLVHLNWNWFGKLFALAWAIPFIALGPFDFAEAGFRKPLPGRIKPGSITVAVLVIVAFITIWFLRTGQPRSTEEILYQLTMLAIAEEVVFRGVLFAALERAFEERSSIRPWWKSRAVWLTAIAFALIHGWKLVHGTFRFHPLACAFPFVFGAIVGALRKYSESLIFPVVLHSAIDVATALFP